MKICTAFIVCLCLLVPATGHADVASTFMAMHAADSAQAASTNASYAAAASRENTAAIQAMQNSNAAVLAKIEQALEWQARSADAQAKALARIATALEKR